MEECISISELVKDTLSETDCSDEEEDDDSYIEIQLDTTKCYNDDDDDDGEVKEESQFRISISSIISVSLPDFQKENAVCTTIIDDNNNGTTKDFFQKESDLTTVPKVAPVIEAPFISTSLINRSTAHDDTRNSVNPYAMSIMPLQHSRVTQTECEPMVKVEFSSNRRIYAPATCVVPHNNVDLLYARNQPSLTKTATKEGIMKLLIKFRGIKMGSLLASLLFLKPQQQPCSKANNNNSNNNGPKHMPNKKSRTFFHCYQTSNNGRRKSKPQWDLEEDGKKSSRVMKMDLGALRVRGIFNVMSRSKRRTQSSTTTSCDISPIHQQFSLCSKNSSSDETSIQAAIAYCKSSCGLKPDFVKPQVQLAPLIPLFVDS